MSAGEPPPAGGGGRAVYTLEDLRRWPEATAGLAQPLRLAIFGDPVAHSASPPMHNAALAALALPLRYARIQVREHELAEALALVKTQGFIGVNLTLPHKTAALSLLEVIDPHAARLGAVNTVRVERDGRLQGFNTDGPGFAQALRDTFDLALAGKRVLILGAAGGAGRALATQCLLERCGRLVLVNRTLAKAQLLARDLHTRFPEQTDVRAGGARLEVMAWEDATSRELPAEIDLVINTSSVGLKTEDPSPLAPAALHGNMLLFDTVYRASGPPTSLVAAARAAGVRATGGLALLLHQGALSFEHWFGRPAPLDIMQQALQAPA